MKIKKLLLTLLMGIGIFPFGLFASPQVPDYIIYKGDTTKTYYWMLESYLMKGERYKYDKLFGLTIQNGTVEELLVATNCWRGYQAIYEIVKDSLFLVDILKCNELDEGRINKAASLKKMEAVFPGKVINHKVFMDWYSGEFSFPINDALVRWNGTFFMIFEKERVVNVYAGKVLKISAVKNYVRKKNAIDRRNKEKVPAILFNELKKVKWKNVDTIDCSESYLITVDITGKISGVCMSRYQFSDSIDKYWEIDKYNYCINTIYNALKSLRFDIIKKRGHAISEDLFIEIWFDSETGKIENWTH